MLSLENWNMLHSLFGAKAYFPLGEFVRTNRQKSRNGSYLFAANFFASQSSPITSPDSRFRFASREQSRQVENRLKLFTVLYVSLACITALRSSGDVQPRDVRPKIYCPCSFLKFIINLAARFCNFWRRSMRPLPCNGNTSQNKYSCLIRDNF